MIQLVVDHLLNEIDHPVVASEPVTVAHYHENEIDQVAIMTAADHHPANGIDHQEDHPLISNDHKAVMTAQYDHSKDVL